MKKKNAGNLHQQENLTNSSSLKITKLQGSRLSIPLICNMDIYRHFKDNDSMASVHQHSFYVLLLSTYIQCYVHVPHLMYLCNLLNLPLESPSLGCTSSYNSLPPYILTPKIPFLYILLEFPSLTTLILQIPYFYFILQFFLLDFYQIMRIYIKLQASNLCCCKSVKVCVFYSQTICVDIQYTDA